MEATIDDAYDALEPHLGVTSLPRATATLRGLFLFYLFLELFEDVNVNPGDCKFPVRTGRGKGRCLRRPVRLKNGIARVVKM